MFSTNQHSDLFFLQNRSNGVKTILASKLELTPYLNQQQKEARLKSNSKSRSKSRNSSPYSFPSCRRSPFIITIASICLLFLTREVNCTSLDQKKLNYGNVDSHLLYLSESQIPKDELNFHLPSTLPSTSTLNPITVIGNQKENRTDFKYRNNDQEQIVEHRNHNHKIDANNKTIFSYNNINPATPTSTLHRHQHYPNFYLNSHPQSKLNPVPTTLSVAVPNPNVYSHHHNSISGRRNYASNRLEFDQKFPRPRVGLPDESSNIYDYSIHPSSSSNYQPEYNFNNPSPNQDYVHNTNSHVYNQDTGYYYNKPISQFQAQYGPELHEYHEHEPDSDASLKLKQSLSHFDALGLKKFLNWLLINPVSHLREFENKIKHYSNSYNNDIEEQQIFSFKILFKLSIVFIAILLPVVVFVMAPLSAILLILILYIPIPVWSTGKGIKAKKLQMSVKSLALGPTKKQKHIDDLTNTVLIPMHDKHSNYGMVKE